MRWKALHKRPSPRKQAFYLFSKTVGRETSLPIREVWKPIEGKKNNQ